nr:MAG TPA: hypothetical protein [Caudoviricetes sp.]
MKMNKQCYFGQFPYPKKLSCTEKSDENVK